MISSVFSTVPNILPDISSLNPHNEPKSGGEEGTLLFLLIDEEAEA